MIVENINFQALISSNVRKIEARAELFEGSALVDAFRYDDYLKEFVVDRLGDESKFFGFGICQRLNLKLIDTAREKNITTANTIKIQYGANNQYTGAHPLFKVSEVNRAENTNELSITAYDAIYGAAARTVGELGLEAPYAIGDFAVACAGALGLMLNIENVDDACFDTDYPTGANFEGTEDLRSALDWVAEATQTIYFINHNNELTFKRLDKDGEVAATIGKAQYFTLDSKTNRRLTTICNATELGDNISASYGSIAGTTQYVRDNPFWNLDNASLTRETLTQNAIDAIGGLTLNQFTCTWRGNPLLEIGDKIALTTKDNNNVFSYVLNDSITYNGFLSQTTQWNYTENNTETPTNPATIGEALKQTVARVDKTSQQIELMVNETNENAVNINQLQIDTKGIGASVSEIEKATANALEGVAGDVKTLTSKVNTLITKDEVVIEIQKSIEKGVSKVETITGYTLNEQGLTVAESNNKIKTTISNNGMQVYRSNNEVLTANDEGVKAEDLHATTFLIIGKNSRFEDFGARTACFWIGG